MGSTYQIGVYESSDYPYYVVIEKREDGTDARIIDHSPIMNGIDVGIVANRLKEIKSQCRLARGDVVESDILFLDPVENEEHRNMLKDHAGSDVILAGRKAFSQKKALEKALAN